jgi:glycosyltransferase involved in cell wall biosynthesis
MNKILFIIGQLRFGGAERQLLYLLQGLDRSKYAPTLCVLEAGEVIPEFRSLGLPIVFLRRNLPRYDISRFLHLLRLIQQVRPRMLHAFLDVANFYAGMAGLLTSIPVVISERSANPQPFSNPVDQLISAIMMRRASLAVANSRAGANLLVRLHGLQPEKITVIYNGLDPTSFDGDRYPRETRQSLGLHPDVPVIGIIGSMYPAKDHANFFQAIDTLRRQCPLGFQVVCVGSGPTLAPTVELARSLGLEEFTVFTGKRTDVPDIMAALDILVSSSRYEGLPNVIMEAMAARKPVVATAVGGSPELVAQGTTGFLAPPRNPSVLADKIQTLLENTDMAARMGEAGRLRVEQEFSLAKMIRGTEAVYQSLLRDG